MGGGWRLVGGVGVGWGWVGGWVGGGGGGVGGRVGGGGGLDGCVMCIDHRQTNCHSSRARGDLEQMGVHMHSCVSKTHTHAHTHTHARTYTLARQTDYKVLDTHTQIPLSMQTHARMKRVYDSPKPATEPAQTPACTRQPLKLGDASWRERLRRTPLRPSSLSSMMSQY